MIKRIPAPTSGCCSDLLDPGSCSLPKIFQVDVLQLVQIFRRKQLTQGRKGKERTVLEQIQGISGVACCVGLSVFCQGQPDKVGKVACVVPGCDNFKLLFYVLRDRSPDHNRVFQFPGPGHAAGRVS